MMAELKTWIICVTAVCFSGVLIRFMLPPGRVSENVITVLRLMVLCAVIIPLFNMNISAYIDDVFSDDVQAQAAEYESEKLKSVLLQQTQDVLHENIGKIVEQYYSAEYEIVSDMDILSDNSIHIKQVQVELSQRSSQYNNLLQALQAYCPICEIVFKQEVKNGDG